MLVQECGVCEGDGPSRYRQCIIARPNRHILRRTYPGRALCIAGRDNSPAPKTVQGYLAHKKHRIEDNEGGWVLEVLGLGFELLLG